MAGSTAPAPTVPIRTAYCRCRSAAILLTPVFAPGAVITGAGPGGSSYNTTGTSQAAAYVSGLAALAQQLADELLGRRLTPGEFLQLLSDSGDTIVDGDDEDDNVANTGDSYTRVNALALAEAIEEFAEDAPPPVDTDDIPGDPSTTVTLPIGSFLEGELETRGDTDWYRVDLMEGVAYRFAMAGLTLEDPWLAVHGPNGAFIVANNDAGGSLDAGPDVYRTEQRHLFPLRGGFRGRADRYLHRGRAPGECGAFRCDPRKQQQRRRVAGGRRVAQRHRFRWRRRLAPGDP